MPKTISSTELQKQTRDAIDYARVERDAVIVETYGRPMAVLLSFDEYQAYVAYKQSLEQRRERFSQLRETAETNAAYNALSEEEALRLVEELREESHTQRNN
ncbi:MAG: type II toxin-antitoxin system Phd/YefM family antitoxin [Chloroflexota bacterium]